MSVAGDIAYILETATLGTRGVDIFISQMPESPDEAAAVYEVGGGSYDYMSELHTAGVTVKTRAADYETAYENILSVSGVLASIGDEKNYFLTDNSAGVYVEQSGTTYLRVRAEGEPYPVGRDSMQRVEFAQSFSATFFTD